MREILLSYMEKFNSCHINMSLFNRTVLILLDFVCAMMILLSNYYPLFSNNIWHYTLTTCHRSNPECTTIKLIPWINNRPTICTWVHLLLGIDVRWTLLGAIWRWTNSWHRQILRIVKYAQIVQPHVLWEECMEIRNFIRRHDILVQQTRIKCWMKWKIRWPKLGWVWHIMRNRNG